MLMFLSSNMILSAHSNISYLSKKNVCSHVGGHQFLSSNILCPPNNGTILNIFWVIKTIMSIAAKAELGGLYINARKTVYIRIFLSKMGPLQPCTPFQTDNITAKGIVNNNIQTKSLKVMDMKLHLIYDCKIPGQFHIYWRPGKTNKADYQSITQHTHTHLQHHNGCSECLNRLKKLLELCKNKQEESLSHKFGHSIRVC